MADRERLESLTDIENDVQAHLIDLKREHLIDQVCVQEILSPEVPEPDSLGG